MPHAPEDTHTLIDELLAEQQTLTAVERFARQHTANGVPAQAKFYRDLIPLNQPKRGEQYAFEVDLDKCSGCKACVSACHSLNGLDDDETWRSTGLLLGITAAQPFQQTITTACHHCVDPGCLNGCPVLAYDKDPLTGIVRHLDDQCIGCQYCVMKCPYEVPQYSKARGIVRKCDMCHDRLAVGEAPACVQACPSEAIRITLVNTMDVVDDARNKPFLPDSPDPCITLPTTRYKSSRPLPANLLAGDHTRVTPADPHLPLVFMLVLTQLSVGASVAAIFLNSTKWLSLIAASVSAIALGIASLHLGKPLKAWRSFLGWRKSWFSREVIVFSAFVPIAVAALMAEQGTWSTLLKITTAVIGLLGVACSAMIYADTGREFWSASQCFGRFFGTTAVLGSVTALCVQIFAQAATKNVFIVLIALRIAASVVKFGFERRIFEHLVDENTVTLTPLNRTAQLLDGPLGLAWRLRVACGIAGNAVLPVLMLINAVQGGSSFPQLALVSLGVALAGESLERYLFFRAVAPSKMPGGVAA